MSTLTDKKDLTAEILSAAKPQSNFQSLRAAGRSALAALQMPGSKTEEYRFTPVTRVLEKAFSQGVSFSSSPSPVSIDQYLVQGLDANIVVLLNGQYNPALSTIKDDSCSVSELSTSENDPSTLQILGKQVDTAGDPFAAINSALWNNGVLVNAQGASTKPLLILHINDSNSTQAVHNRIVVSVADNASVSIIERTITLGTRPVFQTLTEEMLVGANAKLEYCKIQNEANIIGVCNTSVRQLQASHVNTFTLTTDGVLVRNNLSISIDGENCESHFHGLSLLKGETIGDHHTVVDHKLPNSFSNELYKGVFDGKSKGIFNGKIYVRPNAQKTNAFQSNRNILLTDLASINTKPQLEIWADDVKCSHGCTTGQLDEEALFYLQSRGIGKDQARALLLHAFASQTTELIASEPLKNYINTLVSNRLYSIGNQ